MICIVMGVSGTGKSTIGRLLSDRTGWVFYDADDFHPPASIFKMNSGIPLADSDRLPWLLELQQLIAKIADSGQHGILACSALKSQYRQLLQNERSDVIFVYLRGDYNCIQSRMQQRTGHFMNASLLHSQFEALEEPQNALTIDISHSPTTIVEKIVDYLQARLR